MTVYVTVDYFGGAINRATPCEGCTPSGALTTADVIQADLAVLRVIGSSGSMNLCTHCAKDVIKSIAARFVLHDPRSTRDLMDFFAAKANKATRRPTKMLAVADGAVEVLVVTAPRRTRTPKKDAP